MKSTISHAVLLLVIVGSAAAALRGGAAADPADPSGPRAATTATTRRHLDLLYCYQQGNPVPCSDVGTCDNAYACAASMTDATDLGELFCPMGFMLWNNQEPACPYLYMCCG